MLWLKYATTRQMLREKRVEKDLETLETLRKDMKVFGANVRSGAKPSAWTL